MFLNQLEFQRYIQASAKRAKLGVRWEQGACPHTTGDHIVLPILPASASELDYRKLLHYANHEVDHVLYTNFNEFAVQKCDALRSFLGFIWNGLEDVRIEWIGGKEYEGDRSNSDEVYPHLLTAGLKRMRESVKELPAEKQAVIDRVLPIMWFMSTAQSELYASAHQVVEDVESTMSAAAKAICKKMAAGDYLDVLRNLSNIEDAEQGTKGTLELAKRIYKEVFELDPEEELKRLQQPPPPPKGQPKKGKGKPQPKEKKDDEGEKGKAKPEDKDDKDGDNGEGADGKGDQPDEKQKGEGEGDADGEGESAQGADGKLSDSEPEGEGDGKGHDNLIDVEYQEFLPNAHEMKKPEQRTPSPQAMHIDYSGYSGSNNYTPAVKDQYLVGDFCKNQFSQDDLTAESSYSERYTKELIQRTLAETQGSAFASRVRTKLQVRSKDRYESGVKKGKLQTSLLHRVTIPNAPHLNERVFKRRIQNDTLDTAAIFLGDASGSMYGEKFACMTAAMVQFNEAVGNVIGLPIELHTFADWLNNSTGSQEPLMYVMRDFATRRLAQDELVKRMLVVGGHMTANPDGDAVLWSYDRLRRSRAKRKLLIVASDGQPATCRPGDIDWYTQKVVKQIEEDKIAEIVGIGIMDNNVSRIYKEHYIIRKASELEQALLALIDKKVR